MPTTKEDPDKPLKGEHQANQKNLANVNKTQRSLVLKHCNLQTNIITMKQF